METSQKMTKRAPPLQLFKAIVWLVLFTTVVITMVTLFTARLGTSRSMQVQRRAMPTYLFRQRSDFVEKDKFTSPNCTARTKLALTKTHKTGGTTLMQIFHRYAYLHNLSVVLPTVTHPGRMNLFYLHGLIPKNYLPPQAKAHGYDMLIYHTKYNKENYTKLLGKDAVFITILREPLSHLKSQFNFFNLAEKFKLTGPQPLFQFLQDPGMYDHGRTGSHGTKSPMSKDLGMSRTVLDDITNSMDTLRPGESPNASVLATIETFIAKISKEMDLVMITDYYDESLVMLKRLMCWELRDILYFKMLSFSYETKAEHIPPALVENHRKWDIVDYHLYKHFNRTFWKKVNELGDDFRAETAHFKTVHFSVLKHCTIDNPHNQGVLVVPESRWNPSFTVTYEFCTLLKYGQLCYMSLLYDRNLRYTIRKKPNPGPKSRVVREYSPHCALCETLATDCTMCTKISQDCTLNEYITHLFLEKQLSHFDTSLSNNRRTINGQNQEEFRADG
ncbi:galactosylceramide sulfotransferase-like [Branchiostoma floridae x Branchiostoma japonicum]